MINEEKYYIGFGIDGIVEQIMSTDSRFAALLLSNPEIIDLTNNADLEKINEGFTFSIKENKWIPSRPHASWIFDEENGKWLAPVPMPDDGFWVWVEAKQKWVEADENNVSVG
jgi:hypothetical protein